MGSFALTRFRRLHCDAGRIANLYPDRHGARIAAKQLVPGFLVVPGSR
jgi:hypothetical protein